MSHLFGGMSSCNRQSLLGQQPFSEQRLDASPGCATTHYSRRRSGAKAVKTPANGGLERPRVLEFNAGNTRRFPDVDGVACGCGVASARVSRCDNRHVEKRPRAIEYADCPLVFLPRVVSRTVVNVDDIEGRSCGWNDILDDEVPSGVWASGITAKNSPRSYPGWSTSFARLSSTHPWNCPP